MGRIKLDMKKIEDSTKNQITFSKRRNGLFKKITELSVLCDVDIALVTFSPSGRLSQFPKRKMISDVLKRYIDLPFHRRNYSIEEPQPLLDQLDHIKDHGTKIIFVNNQIKRYEKQIAISKLELQILDAELRSFDRTINQGTTLTEIQWQENFLRGLLKQLMDKKDFIFTESNNIFDSSNFEMGIERNIEDLNRGPQFQIKNANYNNVLKQADPWLNPSRHQYNKHSFHGLLNKTMGSPAAADYLQVQANANFMNNYNNTSANFSFANSPFWDQFCSSSPLQHPQMPPPLYQPMLQETVANETRAATDDVSTLMFDLDEVNWLTNAILNNSDEQNPNVSQPLNSSPRVSAPSIYDPIFQGMGLHVDPFLRVYDLNNNNNNLEDDNLAFLQEITTAFQASPRSNPSRNQNDITSNEEEYPWTDFPPLPTSSDHIQFDELHIEDMIGDEAVKTTTKNPENKDEDDVLIDEEFFVNIPDILIDLDDLDIF